MLIGQWMDLIFPAEPYSCRNWQLNECTGGPNKNRPKAGRRGIHPGPSFARIAHIVRHMCPHMPFPTQAPLQNLRTGTPSHNNISTQNQFHFTFIHSNSIMSFSTNIYRQLFYDPIINTAIRGGGHFEEEAAEAATNNQQPATSNK